VGLTLLGEVVGPGLVEEGGSGGLEGFVVDEVVDGFGGEGLRGLDTAFGVAGDDLAEEVVEGCGVDRQDRE
jgi:hypothetical protein